MGREEGRGLLKTAGDGGGGGGGGDLEWWFLVLLLSFSLFRTLSFPFLVSRPVARGKEKKRKEPGDDEMDLKAQFAGSRGSGRETVGSLLVAGENNLQRKLI